MNLGLADRVVFVTGASGGIGRALASAFADEGAQLVLQGFRRHDALVEWAAAQPFADRVLTVRADVTEPTELDSAFAAAQERFGRVDVCLANAGIWPPDDRRLDEMPVERVREVIGTNLLGATWTARAFLATLAASGPREGGEGASLIFTGSTAGRFGERGHADYAASKAGLVGLMRSLKNEIVALDPFARVNVIEPGWTVTDMTRRELDDPQLVERVVRTMPVRQIARAADIARTALYLASPTMARHVSGQVVTVAGGMEGRVLWEPSEIDAQAVIRRLDA